MFKVHFSRNSIVLCYCDPEKWLPSVTFQLEADLLHIAFWSHDLGHQQINKSICVTYFVTGNKKCCITLRLIISPQTSQTALLYLTDKKRQGWTWKARFVGQMDWGESGRMQSQTSKPLNLLTHLVITNKARQLIVSLKEWEEASWSTFCSCFVFQHVIHNKMFTVTEPVVNMTSKLIIQPNSFALRWHQCANIVRYHSSAISQKFAFKHPNSSSSNDCIWLESLNPCLHFNMC